MTLRAEHIYYHVDGVLLVDDFTSEIRIGDLIGLIGPNGAGKSTLANVISGFLPASSGTLHLNGRPIVRLPPDRIARMGIARTFQTPHLPWNLTALDCVLAALALGSKWPGLLRPEELSSEDGRRHTAARVLNQLGLTAVASTAARDLSFGQQRLLGLAIAFARPSLLLILDEPFVGLKSTAAAAIVRLIQTERRSRAMIIIDHSLSIMSKLASRVWFMHKGRITEFEDYRDMVASAGFRTNYLGSTGPDRADRPGTLIHTKPQEPPAESISDRCAEPLLRLRDLTAGYGNNAVLSDLNLEVYPGDIVGVIGLNGAGKSTFLRAIMGLARRLGGDILLRGQSMVRAEPDLIARFGVHLLVQEHRLFKSLTPRDNFIVSAAGLSHSAKQVFPIYSVSGSVSAAADVAIRRLGLGDEAMRHRKTATFSGGEQAQMALAQLLLGHPAVLLLDEPTSGLDGVSLNALRSMISSCKARGVAVIVVEHTLDFLAESATRFTLLSQGRLSDITPSQPVTGAYLEEQLLKETQT